MSGGQSGYELSEAKAILTELKSIRKAISSGEKEKQDLMQVCDRTFLWVKPNYYLLGPQKSSLSRKFSNRVWMAPFHQDPIPPTPACTPFIRNFVSLEMVTGTEPAAALEEDRWALRLQYAYLKAGFGWPLRQGLVDPGACVWRLPSWCALQLTANFRWSPDRQGYLNQWSLAQDTERACRLPSVTR